MSVISKDFIDNLLFSIQEEDKELFSKLNKNNDKIYTIDLNTRKINGPDSLGIEKDHLGDTFYFVTDRYYDGIDLITATCIIQYLNALGESNIYPVQNIKCTSDKIIIPWCVSNNVTISKGDINYAFKFYKIFKSEQDENFQYKINLNTLVAKSKILPGLDIEKDTEEYDKLASDIEIAIKKMAEENTWEIL